MFFPERLPKRLPEILSERLPERLPARLPTGALDATARRVTIPHDERHDERHGKCHDDGMMTRYNFFQNVGKLIWSRDNCFSYGFAPYFS